MPARQACRTLHAALLRLAQEGWIRPKWGASGTGRRVKFYSITRAGRAQLDREQDEWLRAGGILSRFGKLSEHGG